MASPFELMFNPEAMASANTPFGNIAQEIASLVQMFSQSQGTPSPLQASMPVQGNPFQQVMPAPQGQPGLTGEDFDARFPQAGEINSGDNAMRDPKGTARALRDSVLSPRTQDTAIAQPISYLFDDKQRSNILKRGDRLDAGPEKKRTIEQMIAPNEYEAYEQGKIKLKDKMGIDTPWYKEKFDDGPTREQVKRDSQQQLDKPTAKDFKYYEDEMEKGQHSRDYFSGGTSSDDAWEQQWQRLDQTPEFRAKVQKINHESYNHGDVDVIRDVETSPVLEIMRRKALMHLAGDVVPLPISPGPNAGLPSGAAIMSGQRQIRNGGSNVVPHPAREDWYRRVNDRLRVSDASPDPIKEGQQYAANTTGPTTVKGGGNVTFVLKPNGQWMQYDNMGPVGLMPMGWSPPPVRAPGK